MIRRTDKHAFGTLRSALAAFALTIFTCRAIVPIGYMPAPFDAGGPFLPCHGTSAGALLRMLGAPVTIADAAQAPASNAGHAAHAPAADQAAHAPHGHGLHGHGRHADHAQGSEATAHVVQPSSVEVDEPADHNDRETGIHAAWEHCPLGVVVADAALAHEAARLVPAVTDRWDRPRSIVAVRTSARFRYEARAPPA